MNVAHLLTDTVTLQSPTGSSAYGDPTWGAKHTIKARVKDVQRRYAGAGGVIVATVTILETDQAIASGDRVWLAGTDTSVDEQARRLGTVTTSATPGGYRLYRADLGGHPERR